MKPKKMSFALIKKYLRVSGDGAVVVVIAEGFSRTEMGFELLSALSGVPANNLRQGRLRDPAWKELSKAVSKLKKTRVYVASKRFHPGELGKRLAKLKKNEGRLDLVVMETRMFSRERLRAASSVGVPLLLLPSQPLK
jgi:replicative DNA helicase